MSDLADVGTALERELVTEERTAVRFPVRLAVQIIAGGQECTAETENFSSSGALLRVSTPLPTGSIFQFLLEIPPGIIGTDVTAAIHGEGQVIRSYKENGQNYSAIVINEYRFM